MDESNYLEDFLLSLELLPNNIRRECELIKELDKEVVELNKDLQDMENLYLQNLFKEKESTDPNLDLIVLKEQNEKLFFDINQLRTRISIKISEKAAISKALIIMLDQFLNKLDNDLSQFENDLKNAGEYEAPRGLAAGTEVAAKLNSSQEKALILAQVLSFRSEINSYEIQDIDDKKVYIIPDSQIFSLGQIDWYKKLSKGDQVFALYPDTTIFYPALIIQAPKRSLVSAESVVVVQFIGDEDAAGNIPNRTVSLKYLVRSTNIN